jgi:peptide/nickel transport system permease protein
MAAFVFQRILGAIAVLVAVSVLTFLIFFAIPGVDPARELAGRSPTPATIAAIRKTFDLNQPLPVQYVRMLDQLLISRNLVSYTNRGLLVVPEIAAAAPVTLSLVLGASVIWVVMSVVTAMVATAASGSLTDRMLMGLSLVALSVPVFWLGDMALLLTQHTFHDTFLFSWLPPPGYTPFTTSPTMWAEQLLIPWIVLAIPYVGLYSRVLRGSLATADREDFVRTSRAKGLTERRVLFRHMLRTSLLTFISLWGLDFGALVGGGALLVEVVFGLPGIGRLTYVALTTLDLPVIMATVMYAAFFIVLVNTLVDVAYARLDPRIRLA